VNIRVAVGRLELLGTLDAAAGRDFAALLPLTLFDFDSTEKIADLQPRTRTSDREQVDDVARSSRA
jgi:hypothetical protein